MGSVSGLIEAWSSLGKRESKSKVRNRLELLRRLWQEEKLHWSGFALGILWGVMLLSFSSGYSTSPTLAGQSKEVITAAAGVGDYQAARELYEQCQGLQCDGVTRVLGVNSEIEELAYPEVKLQKEIALHETLLVSYPGHRDILLQLAKLNYLSGDKKKMLEYFEAAQRLDPNGEAVLETSKKLELETAADGQ